MHHGALGWAGQLQLLAYCLGDIILLLSLLGGLVVGVGGDTNDVLLRGNTECLLLLLWNVFTMAALCILTSIHLPPHTPDVWRKVKYQCVLLLVVTVCGVSCDTAAAGHWDLLVSC